MKIPSRPLTRSRRLIARESMVARCDFDRCDDRFANIEMAIASNFDFPNRDSAESEIVIGNVSAERNVEKIRESAQLPTEKPVLRAMRNYDSNARATNTRVSLRLTASSPLIVVSNGNSIDRRATSLFSSSFLRPRVTRSEEGLVTKTK